MGIEGGLAIHLHCQGDAVKQVEIQSSRPLAAVNIFHDKRVDEVLQTLPLLYHVCGIAQASAAVAACEQAMGLTASNAVGTARQMLVWMETAREHCWRILMDWAEMLGEAKQSASLAQIQQMLPELQGALFTETGAFRLDASLELQAHKVQSIIQQLEHILTTNVFAMPAAQWLEQGTAQELKAWLMRHDTIASRLLRRVRDMQAATAVQDSVAFLPALDVAQLHRRFSQADAAAFIARPDWQGQPCETTALARQQHQPLVAQLLNQYGGSVQTRLVARLVELASIPEILKQSLRYLDASAPLQENHHSQPEIGLSQVEAARGRLIHRVELEQDVIQRYQILAPTEWNFHPQGIAAGLLKRLPANDDTNLRQQADLLINSIDPCVQYHMVIH